MQVVACSPLSKLFLPEWEERLLENQELIFKEDEQFKFNVARPAGAIENVHYSVPFRVDDYLRANKQLRDAKDALNVMYYLTGGAEGTQSQETDWTGIVELPSVSGSDRDMSVVQHAVMQAQMSGDPCRIQAAKLRMDNLMNKSWEDTQEAMKRARKIADERVIRQLKTTHINLMNQYKHNKDDGKGIYAPSSTEHFGAYVLRKMIQVSAGRQSMNSDFKKWIQDVWV